MSEKTSQLQRDHNKHCIFNVFISLDNFFFQFYSTHLECLQLLTHRQKYNSEHGINCFIVDFIVIYTVLMCEYHVHINNGNVLRIDPGNEFDSIGVILDQG